jgi:hypothetical protein
MGANEILLVWLLGYASAVLVFQVLGYARPVVPDLDRPSALPKVREEV